MERGGKKVVRGENWEQNLACMQLKNIWFENCISTQLLSIAVVYVLRAELEHQHI